MRTKELVVGILVSFLLGCGSPDQGNQEIPKVPSASNSSNADSTSGIEPDNIPGSANLPPAIEVPTEAGITVADAAQLAPAQVQDLLLLAEQAEQREPGRRFRTIAPTYIPSGFKVRSVEIDRDTAVVGPDYATSYTISYWNPNSDASFSIDGSSGQWGAGDYEHQDIKVFSEALGIVILAVTAFDQDSNSSSFQLRDAPIVRNGRGYFFNGSGISPQDAVKIVQSLQYMDSPQTRAKPLEEISRDADRLTSKFDFPLDSCGDRSLGASDRWYPVFIDGASSSGGEEYCKDAGLREVRGEFAKIQVGSFTSYERASDFAKAVGGRVGQSGN